jgi:hypothetical protein
MSHHQASFKTLVEVYKVTVYVRSYFVHLEYGFKCSLTMTHLSQDMLLQSTIDIMCCVLTVLYN